MIQKCWCILRTIVPIYQSEISPPNHVRVFIDSKKKITEGWNRGAPWHASNLRATLLATLLPLYVVLISINHNSLIIGLVDGLLLLLYWKRLFMEDTTLHAMCHWFYSCLWIFSNSWKSAVRIRWWNKTNRPYLPSLSTGGSSIITKKWKGCK